MLTSIGVKNFKSLGEVDIDIKPLTILLGANCSGKSSLLQTLLLMKQTVTSRESKAPLVLRENLTDLGAYQDIVKDHDLNNAIRFKVGIEAEINLSRIVPFYTAGTFFPDLYDKDADRFSLNVEFKFSEARNKIYVSELAYKNEIEEEYLLKALHGRIPKQFDKYLVEVPTKEYYSGIDKKTNQKIKLNKIYFYDCLLKNFIGFLRLRSPDVQDRKKFTDFLKKSRDGFIFENYSFTDADQVVDEMRKDMKSIFEVEEPIESSMSRLLRIWYSRAIDHVVNRFESEFDVINYLGPVRKMFQRFYIASGVAHRDVGPQGELAIDILHSRFLTEGKRSLLIKKVTDWLQRFGMANKVRFGAPKSKDIPVYLYTSVLENRISNIWSPMANQGFGISQVLPLIVEGFYVPPGSTLLVEQPEIHLHPAAQFLLGDLLVEISQRGNRKEKEKGVNLIVETHSEYIVRRLQTLVAKDSKSKKPTLLDNLAIYLFQMEKGGTTVSELKLDPKGRTINWPPEFRKGFLDGAYFQAEEQDRHK